MTYCLGMALNDGLVFAADSRTNAGVDHISTFRKMRVYERPGDRVLVLLSSGNLAITQSVLAVLDEANAARTHGECLWRAKSLFAVARLVGDAVRVVHKHDASHLREHRTDFNAAFILGGQLRNEEPRLFQIYAAGNFIEASPQTPYFQIGETKYGKPLIDRVISVETDLARAAKCALLSLDSTIRSNMTVGLPIDLLVYKRDSLRVATQQWIKEDDPYFNALRHQWGVGMRKLFNDLPDPHWQTDFHG